MIKICEPDISDVEKKYVVEAIEQNEISGHGNHIKLFEQKFAEYIGVKHAILVPNGTIALHLALRVLDVGPGDECILPSSTISSCMFAVHYLGATAVIVDVDKDTWCMDSDSVLQAISPKTKAIMPVDLYGLMTSSKHEYAIFVSGEENYKIPIVEDFAEAIGSEYNKRKAGSIGFLGCCSLFANKNITTGEGGVITTNSDELAEKLRYLRNMGFGKTPETKFWANDLAYNFRPSNLIAALGLGQLERVDYLVGRRLEIHSWYEKYLSPKFIWQKVPKGYTSSYWMEAVLLPEYNIGDNLSSTFANTFRDKMISDDRLARTGSVRRTRIMYRDAFMQYMRENGIDTRPCFPPLGSHPYLGSGKYPYRISGSEENSQYIWENGVLLPSGGKNLTEDVVKHICHIANKFLTEHNND